MINENLHLSPKNLSAGIEKKSNRDGFGDCLVKMGQEMPQLVVLTADLRDSTRVAKFAEKFPERFVEMGVAEQNMAGVAAGLAFSGKVPVMTSFTTFSPGRNWEQIRLAIAYSEANVKIVSTHSGFSAAKDGATHQGLEDLALMRVLPKMTVLEPADYQQTQKALEAALKHQGPVYLRISRHETPLFTTKETPFVIGEAQILKKGEDVTLIGSGPIVYTALEAARELEVKERISVEVINNPSIKPLDEQTLTKSALKTGLVITLEEHQRNGGLGSAVAELLSQKQPVRIYRLGVRDTFGQSGSYEDLLKKYKLDKESVIKSVKSYLAAHDQ
jgi:transketolase